MSLKYKTVPRVEQNEKAVVALDIAFIYICPGMNENHSVYYK